MVLWKLKKCPRCHGDLFLDKDTDGWYEQCLQCGYRRGMKALVTETTPVPDDEGPTPAEVHTRRHRTTTREEMPGVDRRRAQHGPGSDN